MIQTLLLNFCTARSQGDIVTDVEVTISQLGTNFEVKVPAADERWKDLEHDKMRRSKPKAMIGHFGRPLFQSRRRQTLNKDVLE
ncbi:unnamed protein product [Pieris macdunnoughi]|uniref:Uncharacterized protein n=1 Tax=Pieris macdunnoughi TaxID=345717 RepID=A0A821SUR0_9NEOP|nr:unnamed protein product [Pieris macdunnoughi]